VAWEAKKGKRVLFANLTGFPRTFADELQRSYQNEFGKNSALVNYFVWMTGSAKLVRDGLIALTPLFLLFLFFFFLLLFFFSPLPLPFKGKEFTVKVNDFVELALADTLEIARISQIFVHEAKNQEDHLFVVVRWFVPSNAPDPKTKWQVLTERKVDSKRQKYDQVFSFRAIIRRAPVEHLCTAECAVERGGTTRMRHSKHEAFLLNPFMQ